jgi:hypothetical protein
LKGSFIGSQGLQRAEVLDDEEENSSRKRRKNNKELK